MTDHQTPLERLRDTIDSLYWSKVGHETFVNDVLQAVTAELERAEVAAKLQLVENMLRSNSHNNRTIEVLQEYQAAYKSELKAAAVSGRGEGKDVLD